MSFTPEADAYIRKKGDSLYLDFCVAVGSCAPCQPRLSLILGTPRDRKRFREEKIDGLKVYIPRELPDHPLVARLDTCLGFKRLVLEGDIPGFYVD